MKNIFTIFKHDLKSVSKNLIVFVVVIGISILPALYAWFNIASNWDPYSSTGNLPFAVTSNDKGYTYKTLTINAGDEIISNLKQNDKMGWDFVDEDEATQGVENGKYYAAVVIPEDFSEDLLSVTTGDFKQAKLQYYVNEKKNAVAPKITDKGIEAIEESVASTYVSSIAKTIADVLNLSENEFDEKKGELADKVISSLEDAKTDIASFNKSVDVMNSTLDSIKSLIETNKELLPTVKTALSEVGVFTSDVKTIIDSTQGIASQVTTSVEGLIDSGSSYMSSISDQADEAFAMISSDATGAADKFAKIETVNNKIISVNNRVISILDNISDKLGISCTLVTDALERANDKQKAIIDKIEEIRNTITTTGNLPADVKAELDSLISDANNEISSASSEFSAVKQDIDNKVNDSFSSLSDVTDFLQTLNTGTDQLDVAFDSGIDTVDNLKEVFNSLKDFLGTVDEKIDTLIEKVKDVEGSNLIESIIMPIIEDPEALGGFISSPVAYETNRVYPIENYGSAMTPFYSSLALWVGGIVLAAVMNVDLSEKEKKRLNKPNSTQLFFGRYLIIFIIGQIQALIIALGDLYFLKIQCTDPVLFIATCLISSFIYTLIVYSLTITFSVIGKALAVIILVIQIAGSGGTFPIEVLPGPFKTISPFLPFKYGINCLRETVAGVDTNGYLNNLGKLLLFIIPALVLGLLLRKPCIKVMDFFNKKVEESDIII